MVQEPETRRGHRTRSRLRGGTKAISELLTGQRAPCRDRPPPTDLCPPVGTARRPASRPQDPPPHQQVIPCTTNRLRRLLSQMSQDRETRPSKTCEKRTDQLRSQRHQGRATPAATSARRSTRRGKPADGPGDAAPGARAGAEVPERRQLREPGQLRVPVPPDGPSPARPPGPSRPPSGLCPSQSPAPRHAVTPRPLPIAAPATRPPLGPRDAVPPHPTARVGTSPGRGASALTTPGPSPVPTSLPLPSRHPDLVSAAHLGLTRPNQPLPASPPPAHPTLSPLAPLLKPLLKRVVHTRGLHSLCPPPGEPDRPATLNPLDIVGTPLLTSPGVSVSVTRPQLGPNAAAARLSQTSQLRRPHQQPQRNPPAPSSHPDPAPGPPTPLTPPPLTPPAHRAKPQPPPRATPQVLTGRLVSTQADRRTASEPPAAPTLHQEGGEGRRGPPAPTRALGPGTRLLLCPEPSETPVAFRPLSKRRLPGPVLPPLATASPALSPHQGAAPRRCSGPRPSTQDDGGCDGPPAGPGVLVARPAWPGRPSPQRRAARGGPAVHAHGLPSRAAATHSAAPRVTPHA